jgi:hypothetical protein
MKKQIENNYLFNKMKQKNILIGWYVHYIIIKNICGKFIQN